MEASVVAGVDFLAATRDALRLAVAGQLELRCSSCGYGVVVSTAPDRCPMCESAD